MKIHAISRLEPNPVAVKELRGRMRRARAFVLISLYQLLLGGIAILVYSLWWTQTAYYGRSDPTEIGKILFLVSAGFQLLAITLLAPALTAGGITGERQKKTFDLLRTTLLPARAIVSGKLVSALTFLLMIELTSLPVVSIAFLLGGVTLSEFVIAFVLMVVTAVSFCTQGLFVSTLARTTLASTVISYVMLLLAVVVLPILLALGWSMIDAAAWRWSGTGWAWFHTLFYILGFFASTNPLAAGGLTVAALESGNVSVVFKVDPLPGPDLWVLTPWLVFVVYHLLLTALLVWLCIRFVRRMARR